MKTLKMAIALLALTPSLAFAGGHGWGRQRGRYSYAENREHGYYGARYYVPAPVVYVPVRQACEAPRQVVYEEPRQVVYYQERAVNPVAIGIAAGITTALLVAAATHGR